MLCKKCISITPHKATQFNNFQFWDLEHCSLFLGPTQRTYFFFCFVDVGATLREACTSLDGTGILTEVTLEDGESNGIPRELLAGRPFKPLGVVDKVPNELPVDGKAKYKWMKQQSFHNSTNYCSFSRSERYNGLYCQGVGH